jgi:hypothetical protein
MKNVEKAVGVIAVLSLLLGLSLGQNHRQHLKLKELEAAYQTPVAEHRHSDHDHFWCNSHEEIINEKLVEVRARLEAKRMQLEEQRLRLEESERNRLRFQVQDLESGANAIIRIVREE